MGMGVGDKRKAKKAKTPKKVVKKRAKRKDGAVDNGVNVEALLAAREALTAAPEGARFRWKATCDWVNGTHSKSDVKGFFGLGGDQQHKKRFSFETDHP